MDNSLVEQENNEPDGDVDPETLFNEILKSHPYTHILLDTFLKHVSREALAIKESDPWFPEIVANAKESGINASLGLSFRKPGIKSGDQSYDGIQEDLTLNIYDKTTEELIKEEIDLKEKEEKIYPRKLSRRAPYASILLESGKWHHSNLRFVVDSNSHQDREVSKEFHQWFARLMGDFTTKYTESLGNVNLDNKNKLSKKSEVKTIETKRINQVEAPSD